MEDNLSEIFTACWGKLLFGSMLSEHPFHTGVVASEADTGINLRTVVLRATEPDDKQIIFYTDKRSAKISDIQGLPRLSWLFYDKTESIQVRVSGDVVIHTMDDIADGHWQKVRAEGRRSYMAMPGPSAGIDHPANGLEYLDEGEHDPEAGYNNFAVVITNASFIEWLSLDNKGHRRAEFRLIDDSWKGQWLVP